METNDSGVQVSLDWLSLTFNQGCDAEEVMKLIAEVEAWEVRGFGTRGYTNSAVWGDITVSWGGSVGVHMEITGTGIRELQTLEGWDWRAKLREWGKLGYKVTRLDVAFDDRVGLLDLSEVRRHLVQGALTTRARQYMEVASSLIGKDSAASGYTIGVGSRSSDTYLRFYDKAKEQLQQGHWVRCEMELKRDRANAAAAMYVVQGEKVFAGILRGHIQFREMGTNVRLERCKVTEWWDRFLSHCSVVKLTIIKGVKTLDEVAAWFNRSIAPTFALLLTSWAGDMRKVSTVAEEGASRWKAKHRKLLAGIEAR